MPPRLVPKSDGYADYVDQPQGQGEHGTIRALPPGPSGRTGYAGHRRKGRGGHAGRGRRRLCLAVARPRVLKAAHFA